MVSRKMVLMNLFAGQQWRHREHLRTRWAGEEGEDGANGESRMKTCETICEIDSQWELAV